MGLRSDRTRPWLDGYERQGVRYSPVIRPESTRDDVVTWGEFVELGYLREYCRKGVPLQRLRPVIDELRRGFETPYPLATAKPYIFGKEVEFDPPEQGDVQRSRPAGFPSPVDPLVRFGRPSVQGVATACLWELFDAGETLDEISKGDDMSVELVRAAVSYKEQLRLLAA